MNVLSFDYDIDTGFAWMEVDGKSEGDKMTVQVCLKQPAFDPEQESMPDFLEEIDMDDCGHNDGICGDVNATAFEYWGENRCMKALFAHAEKAKIKLV